DRVSRPSQVEGATAAAGTVAAIVWLGQAPVMVTLLPATRAGVAVPVPPEATDTGVARLIVPAPTMGDGDAVRPVPAATLVTVPVPPPVMVPPVYRPPVKLSPPVVALAP